MNDPKGMVKALEELLVAIKKDGREMKKEIGKIMKEHYKKIRREFRNGVYKRDNHTCMVCFAERSEEELDAHHITDRSKMPNGGYVLENGITVCKDGCHMKCEEFHKTNGESWHKGLHPNDLYAKIGSSYELAVEKSENL